MRALFTNGGPLNKRVLEITDGSREWRVAVPPEFYDGYPGRLRPQATGIYQKVSDAINGIAVFEWQGTDTPA